MSTLLTSENERLKQNQRVSFKINDIQGKGKIVGMATSGSPIIGKSYIIEPDEPISNEVYDYSHFVAFEYQLKLEE